MLNTSPLRHPCCLKNFNTMIQKSLFTLPVLLLSMSASATTAAPAAATPAVVTPAPIATSIPVNDTALRQGLLGTWQAVDSPTATHINGEGTFTADGNASGYTTATYVYNDGYTSDVKVGLTFKWSLENNVLTLNNFVSDPSQFIKPTHIKRFEVLTISPDSMTLKDLADGEIIYRRRKAG